MHDDLTTLARDLPPRPPAPGRLPTQSPFGRVALFLALLSWGVVLILLLCSYLDSLHPRPRSQLEGFVYMPLFCAFELFLACFLLPLCVFGVIDRRHQTRDAVVALVLTSVLLALPLMLSFGWFVLDRIRHR